MDRQEVREAIQEKFGTLKNFCEMSNLDYRSLRNFFSRPKYEKGETITAVRRQKIQEYYSYCQMTPNPDRKGMPVTSEDKLGVYTAIIEASGNVQAFCKDNPQFDYNFVNSIVNDRVATRSQAFIELEKFLLFKNGP